MLGRVLLLRKEVWLRFIFGSVVIVWNEGSSRGRVSRLVWMWVVMGVFFLLLFFMG